MARFMYKVRGGSGELLTGMVQAATVGEAGQMLRAEGKFLVTLEAVNEASLAVEAAAEASPRGHVKRSEVITFAHQMAVMIETGVPISEALQCVADQATNPNFKAALQDVAEQVQAGGEFSAALRTYPKIFPPVMTSLIRASEVSGTMGKMLDRISGYLAKEYQTARKIRGALTYPFVMLVMLLGVTIFLLTFVLPKFASIYQARDTTLPVPTRVLMGLSDVLTSNWPLCVGGSFVAIISAIIALRTQSGKRFIDSLKIRLPILGPLFTKLYITRGCRTMGTMINAGVPILDMIAIVKQVTHNVHYEELWDVVDERLRQGSQLSDGLFGSPLIPRSVAQMIYSGEKSGRLATVMEKIAHYTEVEFDDQVKQTTQYVEPALVAAMGLIIGFVAIAMLLPIFSISKVVAG
jgi:type IV pilus assembly protein PilC